ncbi:tetratricopeptide repeat protein [Actinomadura scrupuli]|uniref:tetratricopeptide repeat protein n=1 Tax=Actinomadura scrupuli TaxID=559629 RepID=UPI003D985343
MVENLSAALDRARQAAIADPQSHGGEFALLLADQGFELMRSGQWEASLPLLDEAGLFIGLASGQKAPKRKFKQIESSTGAGTVPAFRSPLVLPRPSLFPGALYEKRSASEAAVVVLKDAVRVLPSDHALSPIAKSRLGHRLLQVHRRTPRTGPLHKTTLDEAIRFCREAVSDASDLDTELLANLGDALRARFDLTSDVPDLDEAVSCLRRAVQLTATGHSGLHALLSVLGDALRARFDLTNDPADLDEAVSCLARAVELTPAENHDRPAVLSNFGAALRRRFDHTADPADLDEAISHLRAAWQFEGHQQELVRSNLGAALLLRYERTVDAADQAEALEHLNAAAAATSPDTPERPAILSTLAEALCAGGKLSAARDLLSEALRGREATLGPEHPSTLASRHNLATVMAMLGHCSTAVEEFREVLRARRRVLGDDHPDTLASLHNLATALADLGRVDEAEAGFAAVVRARNAVLGPDHPDTRASAAALERIQRR